MPSTGVRRGELFAHLDDLRKEILHRERLLEEKYEKLKSDVEALQKAAGLATEGKSPTSATNGASSLEQETNKPTAVTETIPSQGSRVLIFCARLGKIKFENFSIDFVNF